MRALYFVEGFWPEIGGVESISASLVQALAGRGHEVLVVTDQTRSWMPAVDRLGDVPIRRLPLKRAFQERDLELLAELRATMNAIIEEHRPGLIHAVFSGPGVWLLPADGAVPLIVSFHGSWPTVDFGASDGLAVRTLRRANWVTACSESALADLLASAPYLAQRASVVLNGLDPVGRGEAPPPAQGAPVLLCAGRVVHDKGMDVAIDALALLAADFPGARLRIAGDGPERARLTRRARSRGLGDRVEFLGWVPPAHMPELVSRSSIVLCPSRLEGFGLVALEAALAARPVVAARVGGLPEVVEDGVTGVLVPQDDVEATAEAIRALLADPARAETMGVAARTRAAERFGAGRHVDEWELLYRRIGSRQDAALTVKPEGNGLLDRKSIQA